jgi:3-phosphoshikimate 1-carboxyvinyltransferase
MRQQIILTSPSIRSDVIIDLPSSKSISNRILIISALAKIKPTLIDLSDSDDTEVLKNALLENKSVYDLGHSGTSTRFFIAYCCIAGKNCVITGSSRMKNRPLKPLIDALTHLGGKIKYLETADYLPIEVQKSILKGGFIELDPSISSQYCSALMLIAPYIKNGLIIKLKGTPVSEPYIKMTDFLMRKAGINNVINDQTIAVPEGEYQIDEFIIEKDWSSAAFWYGWIALSPPGSRVLLKNLQISGLQGDENVIEYYKHFGVETLVANDGICIQKEGNQYREWVEFNLKDSPDLAPVIATTMVGLNQKGKLTGLQTLNHKESKRIEVLKQELQKTGAIIHSNQSTLEINGFNEIINDLVFESFDDHRMAMAFSALIFKYNKIGINNYQVVSKSYPEYWENVKKCCTISFQ